MARPVIDIRVLGDKALERTLATFADTAQKTVVRGALRKSSKRVHPAIVQAFSGSPVGVRTGVTLAAMVQAKPKTITRLLKKRSGRIGYGIPWPSREELGIDPEDKFFYPAVLEYGGTKKNGVHIPAKMPIRSTVNRMERAEKRQMVADMKKGIERRWRREMKKLGRKIA